MAKKILHPKTDAEFSNILPALSPSEYTTLEQMCIRDGILDPVFIWNGKIVDGHNRVQIAKKHKLPYKIRELKLPDKEAVKQWILEYQLARRSISTYDKIVLALKFEGKYTEQAKGNLKLSRGKGAKGRKSDTQPFRPIDVLTELGKISGSNRSSVSRVKYILKHGTTDIKEKCSKGELPINTAFMHSKDHARKKRKDVEAPSINTFINKRGEYENDIICGDALKTLKKLPDSIATCFIFSPPYNNGTNYSFGIEQDSRPHNKYINWLGEIVCQCSRILRDGGRLIINVDAVGVRLDDKNYECGTKYTIYPDLMNKVKELKCGLIFRDEICWIKKSHGGRITAWGSYLSAISPNIKRTHEYVIVWQKGKDGLKNITGISSDLTKDDWNKSIYSAWEIPPETARHKDHPSPFPEELVRRLIKLYSFPGDLICDVFCGIGATTAAAASLGRRWLGIDINSKYCTYALKRTNTATVLGDNNKFLTTQLITYIGNKRNLLDLIAEGISIVKERTGKDKLIILDGFSGSGVVSRALKRHASVLHSNDIEYYSQILNKCYLTNPSDIDYQQITDTIEFLNSQSKRTDKGKGFIEKLYAPKDDNNIKKEEKVFYTNDNARIIDNIRRMISDIDTDKQHLYIAPLLVEASIHANTSGVFKGFYKNSNNGKGQFGGNYEDCLDRITSPIVLPLPILGRYECDVKVWREDVNRLVKKIGQLDLAYYDPPYNQHPYGSNYFMLNLIAKYKKPGNISRVSGIPEDWQKSAYNIKSKAEKSFDNLIKNTEARFILVSYNNEGFISPPKMKSLLKKYGKVEVLEKDYNTFRGSRNLGEREIRVKEYLYIVEKK
ncbi:MAG: DNA methyltransferase [Planctomycetota bacterium]